MGEERFHKQCTKALTTEEKTSKMDFIKIKKIVFINYITNRIKRQVQNGKSYIELKTNGLIFRIYNSNTSIKTYNPTEK